MEQILPSITTINGILALILGLVSIIQSPRNIVNQAFTILAFFTAAWGLVGLTSFDAAERELATFAAASLTVAANLHLTKNIIGSQQRSIAILSYIVSLLFCALFAAPHFGFDFFANETATNLIQNLWLVCFVIALLTPTILLFTNWQAQSGAKKYQIKFVLGEYVVAIGVSIAILVTFWQRNLSLAHNIIYAPHVASALHLFLVLYLFVQYKFLELKIIAPAFFKRLLAFCAAALAASYFFPLLNLMRIETPEKFTGIIVILIALFAYSMTLRFFDATRWFEAVSLENFRRAVEEFKNKNRFYESVAELESTIQADLCPRIGVREARVVVLNLDGEEENFPELKKYFSENPKYLVTAEEEYLANNKNLICPYLEELKNLGDACFPLFQNTNELIGLFTIKKGVVDDIYIEEELQLLEQSVHYVALSLMGVLYTEKLRQQAEELRGDYAKLKTLDDAKDAFIANVSHELRTPATAVKGYSDLLISNSFGELNEKQTGFAQKIKHNTDWLISLLNDILETTKLEGNQISFNFEAVNMKELLEKAANEWKQPCAEKNLKFTVNTDALPDNLWLQTDAKRFAEVLQRLLANAHKFTDEGEVSLSAVSTNDALEISISDTGIGISAKKLDNIWDKFFQSTDFLEKGDTGTGLGLAIVKKLVENLGGQITVQSELAKGSTFTLIIPLNYG